MPAVVTANKLYAVLEDAYSKKLPALRNNFSLLLSLTIKKKKKEGNKKHVLFEVS